MIRSGLSLTGPEPAGPIKGCAPSCCGEAPSSSRADTPAPPTPSACYSAAVPFPDTLRREATTAPPQLRISTASASAPAPAARRAATAQTAPQTLAGRRLTSESVRP